jgi:predicted kinase
MLCGFVGSGKTTYARHLERDGCERLSVDELVYGRHGEHGIDYAEADYPRYEAEAHDELATQLKRLVTLGRCVVLDYGFWSKEARDRYKQLIIESGGQWRLLYFAVDLEVIRRRLRERNKTSDPNALRVDDRMLEEFLTRWEPPAGEGEELVP